MITIEELFKQFEIDVDTHHLDAFIAYHASNTKTLLLYLFGTNVCTLEELERYISDTKTQCSTKALEAWNMFFHDYSTLKKISFHELLFSWARETSPT